MIEVKCDKCSKPAIGFLILGDPSGQRKFDLCPDHLHGMAISVGKYFGVDLVSHTQQEELDVGPA